MKNTFAILALAAASATATNFHNAPAFSCPGNTNNHCTPKQSTGFDFSDLPDGNFNNYDQFTFKGFSCKSDTGKRFAPRTGGKKIAGSCGSTKQQSPSFGCNDGFSLGVISVKPEFDCDLEFHYDMPDGSTCKHRNSCSKSGTSVKNDQCGGAHNVTIVFPTGQPSTPPKSTTCSIEIPTMTFDCSTASSTKPPKTTTTKASSTKTTKSSSVATTASETKPGKTTTTSTSAEVVKTTSSEVVQTTSSVAAETTSSTSEVETSTTPETTAPPATTQPPFLNGTTSSVEQTTSEVVQETTSETSTFVTSFLSTSTIFTTSVSTITSCASTVTDCPAGSIKTTIVTVAQSTTICPVTETRTTVHTRTKATKTKSSTLATATGTTSAETTASPVESSSSIAVDTTTTSAAPVETLPCPDVVPQCLNTFLFSVGCSDNTDSDCYCPDEIFVKNIFNCIYAHGESAQVVSEAVIFFQGICAPHIPSNPAIATGATVTSYVTVTGSATSSLAPVYTTVTIETTTVVPCTDSAGSTIASSSSTIVISTAVTVPQVQFTTGTGTGSSVALVPATTAPAAITAAPTTTKATGTALVTAPAGTGSFTPKPTASGIVTVSGSGRVTASFGLVFAAAMALVAAL